MTCPAKAALPPSAKGFRVQRLGFGVWGLGYRIHGSGVSRSPPRESWVQCLKFGDYGEGFRTWGFVLGLGVGVWGLGLEVWALRFGESGNSVLQMFLVRPIILERGL